MVYLYVYSGIVILYVFLEKLSTLANSLEVLSLFPDLADMVSLRYLNLFFLLGGKILSLNYQAAHVNFYEGSRILNFHQHSNSIL